MGFDGKGALVMASEHVEGYAGDQVDLGVEADLLRAAAAIFVGDHAVEGVLRG